MTQPFIIAAIPLNRPAVRQFLADDPLPQGAPVNLLDQRPTPAARKRWEEALRTAPDLAAFLSIHDPHHLVAEGATGRLVPRQFLDDPGFLTRNMGGWSALYFGVMQLPDPLPSDPLLDELVDLQVYGPAIASIGPDSALTADRVEAETGLDVAGLVAASLCLAGRRPASVDWRTLAAYVEQLLDYLEPDAPLVTIGESAVPQSLLLDEVLDAMVRIEAARRTAEADGRTADMAANEAWQAALRGRTGTAVILKGEYIMGRHRRSTILLVPELGVVVKQPGAEPLHEVALSAVTYNGQPENWPAMMDGGALVTAAGRIRLTVEEGLVPRLSAVCGHDVLFSTVLGLSVEALVPGPTFQAYVLEEPERLSAAWYEEIVLHQQICEVMGVENGDWHTANFMVRDGAGPLVHVDWGAARLLRPDEMTAEGALARLNQVRNIAFSLHDEALADRMIALHDDLVADPDRMAAVQAHAQQMVAAAEEHGV